jgi:FemAB-related protein (PEP-CTERM system-associated)
MNNRLVVGIYTGDGSDWDAFISSHPASTNYHLFRWKMVVERSFCHKSYYLAVRNQTMDLVGVLPVIFMQSRLFGRFLVSMPFFNYGGLLYNDPAAIPLLLAEAERIMHEIGATHLELRHLGWKLEGLPAKNHKVTMVLDLFPDIDSQWKAFNPKLRNQVRKAEKSGLQVLAGGIELLDGFYEVFCRNMRDLGTPVYGKVFFKNVLTEFPNTTRIFSVMHGPKVIASGFASWFKGSFEIPWASSIREYNKLCPNNILYWKAISFAIEHHFTQFDFGRSTPNEGTYKFKEQWGAKPIMLHWQYMLNAKETLPELNTKNPKYQQAIALWRRMPLGLTKLLGPFIVRNIP